MRTRGFTIVEVIVTITIMGILFTLAVVGVGATQLKARDNERQVDIEVIASNLESFFKSGRGDLSTSQTLGRYPTTNLNSSAATMELLLENIDTNALMAPGITDPTDTFKAATNAVQSASGVTPAPTKDHYIYQPLFPNGTLCTGVAGTEDCRKFNLYYRLEGDNTVYMVTSKNQ
jgi:prepilin-type N-terminal cleavage/methylation domain-containing protein